VAAPDTAAPDTAADTAGAAADTARVLPSQLLVIRLPEGVQLTPEAKYTVAVTGVRNVVGLTGDSQAEFTAEPPSAEEAGEPEPEAPADDVPDAEPEEQPEPGPSADAVPDTEPDPEPEPIIP